MIVKILAIANEPMSGERGAVAAEYALLLAFITVALVTIVVSFTIGLTTPFQAAINVLNN